MTQGLPLGLPQGSTHWQGQGLPQGKPLPYSLSLSLSLSLKVWSPTIHKSPEGLVRSHRMDGER